MGELRSWLAVWRLLGVRWILFRLAYSCRRRVGLIRRASPARDWSGVPAADLQLTPRLVLPRDEGWARAALREADAILEGRFMLFSWRPVVVGRAPAWNRNPRTGEVLQRDTHWSRTPKGAGDIKEVWELSRFGWAFSLSRAYARTGALRYSDAFWSLWAAWMDANPLNRGPNWMCGQEATFRLMAVVFAAETFGVPPAHRQLLARFVVGTANRIAANLSYALSQKNNHGVSECVGLITAALLVPAHAESSSWLSRAEAALASQLQELVYADGAFSQHSLVYHRVLLHDLVWCASRYEVAGRERPQWLEQAAERALKFLMSLMDPQTGEAPLYGANDGALVLPVADADFLDFRPTVQVAAAVFRRELPLPAGPWDEAPAWLTPTGAGLRRVSWPAAAPVNHLPSGGCAVLVAGSDRLFFRCPTRFRHRPSQADMLHVDVWLNHEAVTLDGGSFSYDSSEVYTALSAAYHHNVLTVDGQEPMWKFRRFLYLPWTEGACTVAERSVTATHDGYSRLEMEWVRSVEHRPGGGFLVRDLVRRPRGRHLRWHWRLAEGDWELGSDGLRRAGPAGAAFLRWRTGAPLRARLVTAAADSAVGWWSPHYGEARPSWALLLEGEAGEDFEVAFEFFTGS